MMKLIALISSYIVTWLRLLPSGGVRAIAVENMMLRQQLITLSRNHKRAPRLTFFDKRTFGILTSMISLKRLQRIAVIIKPATLLKFNKALVNRKYSLLFSNKSGKKPGSKGLEQSIIDLILEMKQRNSRYGYRRIAKDYFNYQWPHRYRRKHEQSYLSLPLETYHGLSKNNRIKKKVF